MAKSLRKRIVNAVARLYIRLTSSSLAQAEQGGEGQGPREPEAAELLRRAAAEGAVLLKNDGTLPLDRPFALLGRCQLDTFYTGYGSGGDVRRPYAVSILEGLEAVEAPLAPTPAAFYRAFSAACPADRGGWGEWPFSFPEPILPEDVLRAAAREADTAVVVIGRAAGEDRDCEPTPGSFYLSQGEERLLSDACANFSRVAVVLNIGNVIDMVWTKRPEISAVLLIWQGGMETGSACADVLLGNVCPSGKLPMTVARLEDYPADFGRTRETVYNEGIYLGYRASESGFYEAVYPFGFGLSYTRFAVKGTLATRDAQGALQPIETDFLRLDEGVPAYPGLCGVQYEVTNEGDCAGRTVVQVYVEKPGGILQGSRGCPARELVYFQKTKELAPGETEAGIAELPARLLSVYDPARSGYVLQKGCYFVYMGFDAHTADMVGVFRVEDDVLVEACTPVLQEKSLRERILEELPEELPACPPCTFGEVRTGKKTLEEFVGGLQDGDLIALSYGALKMDSPLGPSGNAGVLGGVNESLKRSGVPSVAMTDGPSGVRLRASTSLIPTATLLASTFDPALVGEVYALVGREAAALGSHVMLSPAINLHRHPLCGRNFEYFSEDPLLAGKLAAAAIGGLRASGTAACPKHFACNNQEHARNRNDSVVDERTLRELYLRPFEIAVKEGASAFLMTSYNKVNGVYAHYHYALVRGILRKEWKFEGCVVTDWWMRKGKSPDFRHIKNNAYRIRAGVNVLMPGGSYIGKGWQFGPPAVGRGGLTRAELQRSAMEILSAILQLDITT